MITDINSSKYPNNFDDDNSLGYLVPGVTAVSALHLNQMRSSIFAIERALGVNPGAGMTVSQRLSSLTKDISELFNGILRHSLVFTYDRNSFAAKAIFGDQCESWIVYDGHERILADWPDTGRKSTAMSCGDSDISPVVPLSIVGVDAGGSRGRRVRIYDSVDITKSLRLEKIQDPNNGNHSIFAGIMEAPWGFMTRGMFAKREDFNFDAGLDGCGEVIDSCAIDETSDWSIDCWVDYEIARVGDVRWVNVDGDCMSGDLTFAFGLDDDEYGGTSGYPSAINFGFCSNDIYAQMLIDPFGLRLSADDNQFEHFVHESSSYSPKPLVIMGSDAEDDSYGIVHADRRRLKLIDDVDISGSARVGQFLYTGDNDSVNVKPNFTRDVEDPNYPKVYNGFIVNPNSSVFSVPYYESGFVGGGVTYGHRPGHTHAMADILDLDVSIVGPEVTSIYDTYDTTSPNNPPRNESDHIQGRVVVNNPDYVKGMKVECRRVHFDVASGIYPLLVFKKRGSVQTYTHNTCCGYWSADLAVLEFDLDASIPVGEYDAWIEDTNGLRGYSYFVSGGGLDVVDPLTATINNPSPSGSGSLQTNVSYTFSADVVGGKQPYVTYEWDFGDGVTASGSSPTPAHTYTSAGSFEVTLTVYDVNNFYYSTQSTFQVLECATSVTLTYEIV